MSTEIQAWHFVSDKLRDGREIPADGEKLVHDGEIKICYEGLHASERLIDALKYAPGCTLCRVVMGGDFIRDDDKLVSTERTILWRIDAELILEEFYRWCDLQAIPRWDEPDVVSDAAKAARVAYDAYAAARVAYAAYAAAKAAYDAASATAKAASAAVKAAAKAAYDAARVAAGAAYDAARDAQNQKITELVMAAHGAPL